MDTKNEDAAKTEAGVKPFSNETPKPPPKADTKISKMDISRYLQKADHGKSINEMLKVLFKGQMMSETEWTAAVNKVVSRRAV